MEDLLFWVEEHLFGREHLVHLLVATSSPAWLEQWLGREAGPGASRGAPNGLGHTPASQGWFERRIGELVAQDVAHLISLLRSWGATSPAPPDIA